jgi:hypothetical protein
LPLTRSFRAMPKLILKHLLTLALLFLPAGAARAEVNLKDRPDPGHATEVQIGVYYIDFEQIDCATETFRAIGYLIMQWRDPRLAFAATNAAEMRIFKPDEIWRPYVEVINAQQYEEKIQSECLVSPDGTVLCGSRFTATLKSRMDLRKFPFDRQDLRLVVEPFLYDEHEVKLIGAPDKTMLGPEAFLSEWRFSTLRFVAGASFFAPTQKTFSRLTFSVEASRDERFFLFKMIFPTCLFVLLTWIVFWIKVEDVSTSLAVVITLMLTVVAFGISIDSMIPRLGYRTWFDLFQACCFVSIFITGLECIVVYSVGRRRPEAAEKFRRRSRIVLPAFFLVAALVLVRLR